MNKTESCKRDKCFRDKTKGDRLFCNDCRIDWRHFCNDKGVENIILNDEQENILLNEFVDI